jgi:hypothetical protein
VWTHSGPTPNMNSTLFESVHGPTVAVEVTPIDKWLGLRTQSAL